MPLDVCFLSSSFSSETDEILVLVKEMWAKKKRLRGKNGKMEAAQGREVVHTESIIVV